MGVLLVVNKTYYSRPNAQAASRAIELGFCFPVSLFPRLLALCFLAS